MGRGPSTFKQTDLVRAVKALRAAGLDIVRTEIHPDGRISIHHQAASSTDDEENYEQWKARNGQA